MRMGQDEHVDRSTPPRQGSTELAQRLVGVGAGVSEHAPASRCHDQDAVALAHIQDDQVQTSVRQGRQRGGDQDRGDHQDRTGWPRECEDQAAALEKRLLQRGPKRPPSWTWVPNHGERRHEVI